MSERKEGAGRRWLGPLLLFAAVLLISAGIIGILLISYSQHPSWLVVIVPPAAVVAGTILLLAPLLRRLSREPD